MSESTFLRALVVLLLLSLIAATGVLLNHLLSTRPPVSFNLQSKTP